MKNVKMLLATLLLSAVFSNGIKAQDRPALTPERKAEIKNKLKANKDKLALTPEQEPLFREVNKKYIEKIKALRNSEALPEDKREMMLEISASRDADMKNILSAEQYKTYMEIQDVRRARLQEYSKKKEGM